MRIFVSAAEISSDIHAEKIIRALIQKWEGVQIEICGIGGPRLRSLPGFRCLATAESMRAMGFVEVLSKLSALRSIQNQVLIFLDEYPPDLVLTFDYPDFHFSLMKRIEQKSWFRQALKICGIPPKVWVWRKNRVETIRRLYDAVWVIFPFEKKFYQERGIPVIYEGNPLIADLLATHPQSQKTPVKNEIRIAVLPGSRDGELRSHVPIVHASLMRLSELSGLPVRAEVPIPSGVDSSLIERSLPSHTPVHYHFFPNGSGEVLARNSLGLIKSGTATLEAAVLGCVPIIFYRMNPVSEWIFKLAVRYSGPVGLPNILLGIRDRKDSVFPEFLGREANPEALASEIFSLIKRPERVTDLQKAGDSLRQALVPQGKVSEAVADAVFDLLRAPRSNRVRRGRSWGVGMISFLWSSVNFARRSFRRGFQITAPKLGVKSVLVGNLQAGGAGKTPLVIEIAKEAIQRGFQVGVVSRGYGRDRKERVKLVQAGEAAAVIGDEPAEIVAALPGVKIALSADRILASQALIAEGVNFIVADDGFQNLNFSADLSILAVTDADRNEIPYRDFDSAIRQANLVVQTKGKNTGRFGEVHEIHWESPPPPVGPLWIWCALGDPEEVVDFYRSRGYPIDRVFRAPDHAVPDTGQFEAMLVEASRSGARVAVTPKDAVKLTRAHQEKVLVLVRSLRAPKLMHQIFQRLQ
jgi:lipid-A-disaccharide synthase